MHNDNRRGGFNGGGFVPVKVDQELDVKIEAVGAKGDGIAKKQGFVLFVPGAKEGDNVKVRVTKVLRKMGFAEVVGAGEAKADAPADAPAEKSSEPDAEDSDNFGEEETLEQEV